MPSHFRKQLEDYLSTVEIDAERVLDAGGLQLPVKGRTKSWKVKDYKILDSVDGMKGERPDYVFDLARAQDYHKQIGELEAAWDVVFCLEVMEYVVDPLQAIKNLRLFLKPGGVAYISWPLLYPLHPPADTDFMRYTQHGVEALLHEAGFRQNEIQVRRAGPGRSTLKRFYDEEGMKYRKDDLSFLDHIGYVTKSTKT